MATLEIMVTLEIMATARVATTIRTTLLARSTYIVVATLAVAMVTPLRSPCGLFLSVKSILRQHQQKALQGRFEDISKSLLHLSIFRRVHRVELNSFAIP